MTIRWLSILIVAVGLLLIVTIIFEFILPLVAPERSWKLIPVDNVLWFVLFVTVVEVLLVVALAITLWRIHSFAGEPHDEVRAGLAIALGTGVAIALAILVLQLAVQAISEDRDLRAQRENIRFTIGISPDLTGFVRPMDPGNPSELLDLTGYRFRGKNMSVAMLTDANLRGANFVFADLNGAEMRDVILTDNKGSISDFRAANLVGADLTGAEVGNASFVDADLRNVYLCGVDLRNANLTRTDLRGAKLGEDPKDGNCEVPGQLPDMKKPQGACGPADGPAQAAEGCGAEARAVVERRK
ncbi:pentapeptide repeat-containing protein [Arthrobacter sp. zg-Y1219]|uniref:pentapeptide repeat-containing protein n=1 Tax=Arthrobacter sp. zg-Y1219 TaxID=3049067 RepID=UPI0024C302E5|nr:pentapeptide repeat-containing protein [Arthrobacter sp. zg-Y1219]MDK1359283.1 pentapeptide repeat-containing protein [Arthrobacter sp. zg-Y1219]